MEICSFSDFLLNDSMVLSTLSGGVWVSPNTNFRVSFSVFDKSIFRFSRAFIKSEYSQLVL